MNKMTAKDAIDKLKLEPLLPEGGYWSQTWKTDAGTAIYYLITGDSFSSLHKLDIAETWHFYLGDPVKQLQLYPDGSVDVLKIGSDIWDGFEPQLVCPQDVWQSTRLIEGGEWALLGTTMAPPYTDDCIVYPDLKDLYAEYSGFIDLIKEFE